MRGRESGRGNRCCQDRYLLDEAGIADLRVVGRGCLLGAVECAEEVARMLRSENGTLSSSNWQRNEDNTSQGARDYSCVIKTQLLRYLFSLGLSTKCVGPAHNENSGASC